MAASKFDRTVAVAQLIVAVVALLLATSAVETSLSVKSYVDNHETNAVVGGSQTATVTSTVLSTVTSGVAPSAPIQFTDKNMTYIHSTNSVYGYYVADVKNWSTIDVVYWNGTCGGTYSCMITFSNEDRCLNVNGGCNNFVEAIGCLPSCSFTTVPTTYTSVSRQGYYIGIYCAETDNFTVFASN